MDALSFLLDVIGPVGVEVTVGGDGAEFEDGLGAVESPTGAGDVHAVGDEVAAGAFDHAGGDRPAGGQGGGVVEVALLVQQVGGCGVGWFALGVGEVVVGGLAGDRGGEGAGTAGEDVAGVVADPGFGLAGLVGVETAGGGPE